MNIFKKVQDVWMKMTFILSKRHKQFAVMVFIMGAIAAVLEMLGVAVILPILDIMIDIESAKEQWFIKIFVNLFNLDSNMKIIWFVCLGTVGIYIIKNLYFIFYNWVSLKYAFKVQRELSTRVLRAYMRQGYIFFVENNTSRLLQGIGGDISGVYAILSTFCTVSMKMMTMICIGAFIAIQSQGMAIVLLVLAAICFGFIQILFRKTMQTNGQKKRDYSCECSQTSMEAIQGNKEILVMHKQDYFVDHYKKMVAKLNRVSVKVDLAILSPAYIIEMICISGILLVVAIQMGTTSDTMSLIGQLSTIAVGAFRILPALGGITSGVNTITMNIPMLSAAYATLKGVIELERKDAEREDFAGKYRGIKFEDELKINRISFKYPNTEKNVISDASLTIKKGQSIAFIGPSGAGKTTLSDIILSLLKPDSGSITMDGINVEDLCGEWNKIVGYVPQKTYIVDETIRHNVAFGEDKNLIDDAKVWEALEIAQLDDFVRGLPQGIYTRVGEGGIKFSGGQRQRLAIARAMYRNPEILVLDEATAALDNETEKEVMKAIERLQGYKTLIIVAHRLTTVKNCDVIYEVKDQKVTVKSKEEIFG